MISLVWLIPAFPLAAFLVNGLFGKRWLGHLTGVIATPRRAPAPGERSFPRWRRQDQTVVELYRWIGGGTSPFNVSALIDPLSSDAARVPSRPHLLSRTGNGTKPASIASSPALALVFAM